MYRDTLVVSGHPIPVFELKAFPNDSGCVGEFDASTREMFLLNEYPNLVLKKDTVLHEVVHAISQICLTEPNRLSETQTNTLSTALLDTIQRNPWFKELLLGEDRNAS